MGLLQCTGWANRHAGDATGRILNCARKVTPRVSTSQLCEAKGELEVRRGISGSYLSARDHGLRGRATSLFVRACSGSLGSRYGYPRGDGASCDECPKSV